MRVGGGDVWGISVLSSSQFYVNLKLLKKLKFVVVVVVCLCVLVFILEKHSLRNHSLSIRLTTVFCP